MYNLKIFKQILLLIVTFVCITYLIAIISNIYITTNKFRDTLKKDFVYIAKHKNEEFDINIKNITANINHILNSKDIETYYFNNQEKNIQKILSNYSNMFSQIYFLNNKDEVIVKINKKSNILTPLITREINKIDKLKAKPNVIHISSIKYSKEIKEPIVIFSIQKTNYLDKKIGTLYAIVPIKSLINIKNSKLDKNYQIRVVDKKNNIVLSLNKNEIMSQISTNKKLTHNILDKVNIMGEYSFYYNHNTSYGNILLSLDYDNYKELIYNYLYIISVTYFFIFSISFTILYIFIKKSIKPINKLTKQIKAYEHGDFDYKVYINSDDEISFVAKAFNTLGDALQTKRKELLDINRNLEKRVAQEVETNLQKEKIMLEQSKHAAMGEMIDAVAHQWKQPLSVISTSASAIKIQNEMDLITKEFTSEATNNIQQQVKHMVETIDEFRKFFRPNPKKELINIAQTISETLEIEKSLLITNKIDTIIKGDSSINYELIQTEFKHVFINFINNSIDAFDENNIKNRRLIFTISKKDEITIITLDDNAGGIPNKIIENIFKINFTTKKEGKGTGIGLYMSNQIINKLNGSLAASNIEYKVDGEIYKGVRFTIILP